MADRQSRNLQERVERAAGEVLEASGSVGPLDVLLRLSWLAPAHMTSWRRGISASLGEFLQVSPGKQRSAFRYFELWAENRGLKAVRVPYVRPTPGGEVPLRVMAENDPAAEKFFQTHYVPGDISAARTKRTATKLRKPPDIVVFQTVKPSGTCAECEAEIRKNGFLFMEKTQPLCLSCADLDHLDFLPSGDATLTRRARRHSRLSAVVVRFARARKRYERQGILVEPDAIEKAEQECCDDAEERAVRRRKESLRRAAEDKALVEAMTRSIRQMYPACPEGEAREIARHTAERGSGRIGRSAAGRNLEQRALELAVAAWVRHHHTEYNDLLAGGMERLEARHEVMPRVRDVLARWLDT